MIAHVLPGRIRLRHPALSQERMDTLKRCIRALAPSAELTHSCQNRSTLIVFTEKNQTQHVLAFLDSTEKKPLMVASPPDRRRLRWSSASFVKRGMAGSLLATVGLIAFRRDNGHALAGGIFLVFLSRHLWVHRKRLLKELIPAGR
jgi:hypothetical protein